MILTATPYRVSLFGGGTDHPGWFREQPGAVLGFAIQHYCHVAVRPLPLAAARGDLRYRIVYSRVEDQPSVAAIEHPAVRGALQYLELDTPLEITHLGDLPARSGLGSSSAFTVGLLHALHLLKEENVSREQLAEEAIAVERGLLQEAGGWQDQLLTALGGARLLRFSGGDWASDNLELSAEYVAELESSLVLVHTGTLRNAPTLAAAQLAEGNTGATVEGALCTPAFARRLMAQQAEQAAELLRSEKPLSELGPLLDTTWQLKRGLAEGVTLDHIDELYAHGLACGATGGKLLGAGGGGFLLFFVPPRRRADFLSKIGRPYALTRISRLGSHVLVNR